ncbi:MAG: hypothetical protein KIT10_00155 [Flavobacteriales bacterium]|nr:hypothetical protein [Flavobacteriales bacterium]
MADKDQGERLPDALIGHTGFVGSNLLAAHPFTALFRSTDIEVARGRSFGLLVCAGVRAEKWIANRDEAADRANIDRLTDVLATVSARRAVLISTTDVYADTRGRDEDHPADLADNQPYGRNRALLELAFRALFPEALIVRLPGLFGPGLKKNVIHDLIKDHEVEKIDTAGVHQYYDVRWLWKDLQRAMEAGIRTLNITAPPMRVEDLCADVFGVRYHNPGPRPADYDMRSKNDRVWGGRDGYLYDAHTVLAAMKEFVATHPGRRPLHLPPA